MTPAERDEVIQIAQETIDAEGPYCEKPWLVDMARAILRYVPAGDAEHPAVQVVDVEPDLPPAFRLSVVLYGQHRLQPDEARAIARALHAAADAAEEK